jgi:hypothetical protein
MKKRIRYSDEPIGPVEIVPDFLPAPEELAREPLPLELLRAPLPHAKHGVLDALLQERAEGR